MLLATDSPPVYSRPNVEVLSNLAEEKTMYKSSTLNSIIISGTMWVGKSAFSGFLDAGSILKMSKKLGFAAPSVEAVWDADLALRALSKWAVQVSGIFPTEDGGVLIEYTHKGVFHMLDIYNDGDTIFSKGGAQKVIEPISRNFNSELAKRLA